MLASLLPGLRDIRTPLTVGYLWLLAAWLMFGDFVRKGHLAGNGLVAQLFNLEGFLGKTFAVTALGFIAYLLGAILTIPLENRFVSLLLNFLGGYSQDSQLTTYEFRRWQF